MRPGSLLVSALTTVSQRLTVEPIPASAPEARGASRVGTPSDGGRALPGFGLLWWTGDTQPAYSSALVKGAGDRGHTYTGLQADTLYKFRIHACNGADSCGWWTEPPKEVRTLTPPPEPTPTPTPTATATTVGSPDRPHSIMFPDEYRTSTSVRATWSIASETGGAALTGFGLLRWPTGTAEPPHSQAIVVGDGTATDETMTGLTPATTYVFKMRACNGPNRCSDWTADQTFTTLAGTVTPGRVTNLRHSSSGDNSVTLAWNAPGNSAAAAVTAYHVQNRPLGSDWPGGFDVAQGAGTTTFSVSQLVDGTIYEFQVRACNAAGCGAWTDLRHPDHVIVAGHKVGNASLIPASASLAVGGRLGVGIHDIPKGKVAYAQMYGAIQPAGQCSSTRGTRSVARAPSASTGSGYYDTVNIEGCAPGGIGWLRVVNAAETELYARATIRVGVPPSKVGRPTVTAGNASLDVAWVAPSAGDRPITHYDLQYRAGTSGDWTLVEDIELTSYTITGLTNGTSHEVRVRAASEAGNGEWSDSATGTPMSGVQPDPETTVDPTTPTVDIADCGSVATRDHTAPTGLNVIPLSGHQVRLTWTGSTDSTAGYYVEFNPHGSSWPTVVPASNKKEVFQTDTSTGQLKTCLDFSLDSIITRGQTDQDNDGLADHAAYDIRVRASKTVSGQRVDYVSETITIIDTPITKADGYVPESPTNPKVGQADVTWTAITSVLSDHYADGSYILRPRRLADNPTSKDWRPNAYSDTDLDDTAATSATEQTIGALTPENIYAVQLIYLPDDDATTNDTKVFAARDSYVWPGSTQLLMPGSGTGKLFANFQVWSLMATTTYDYFICTDTFTENADTKAAMDRRQAWVKFIYHALEQWQLATNEVVTMNYLGESCTDYQPIVEMAAKRIAHLMPTEESRIVNHLVEFVQHDWYSEILPANTSDRDKNEIMMFDDYGDYPEGGTLYFAFTEAMSKKPVIETNYPQNVEPIGKFGNRLGFVASTSCWGKTSTIEAIACAKRTKRVSSAGYTTDIVLRRTRVDHDPLAIPGGNADLDDDGFPDVDRGDIVFNKCPSMSRHTDWLPYQAQENRENSVYGTLVHEAGHALGIDHPRGIDDRKKTLTVSSNDTVMTPGKTYNCSPHPLDVLIVYALHRAR